MLFKNGSIFIKGKLSKADILVESGKIVKISDKIEKDLPSVDITGKVVLPGFIDIHTHLRTPGQEYKENIESGTKAAVAGGFTAVCAMPNTNPVLDNKKEIARFLERGKKEGVCKVFAFSSKTFQQQGRELVNFEAVSDMVIGFSDDGQPVVEKDMMEKALLKGSSLNKTIVSHCEVKEDGHINKGEVSEKLGIKGISNKSEWQMVKREIGLAKRHNTPVHIAHVSTKESVNLIAEAKRNGVPVTAEACPHHFLLTDKAVEEMGAIAKVNPPLRSEADRLAVLDAIKTGVIDAVATDHAPHSPEEKMEVEKSPFGIVGLETTAKLMLDLVNKGKLTLAKVVELLSEKPHKILGLTGGEIKQGVPADLTIVDMDKEYIIEEKPRFSKGQKTPFAFKAGKGDVHMTIVDGNIAYKNNEKEG
ncbi:dihydroorotase [Proteinivorax hydrogeniformans]|uniref:Dihydroorotase n=1 Tax=Proteinivorax hydrogeniformans TaxID=1826727 RepID=A0AAU8HPR5_9FIRM